jgi:selenocysteine lyase/cysteine desulfurase
MLNQKHGLINGWLLYPYKINEETKLAEITAVNNVTGILFINIKIRKN